MSTVSAQGILPAKLFPIEWSNMRLIVALSLLASSLQAQNAVKASRFHVEHPTLFNLGFEWAIEGDANRYAVYHAMDLNFALKANSKAVDAGAVIPNPTDSFRLSRLTNTYQPHALEARGSVAEGEHCKGGCRVGHELARVTGGVTFLVDRDASPRAHCRLIAFEPVQTFGNLHVVFWRADSLEDMQDKTGCVA